MIQRIQSIYLFIVSILCGLGTMLLPDWNFDDQELLLTYNQSYLAYWYLALAVLSLWALFLYKNRSLQMRLTRINIFMNLLLLGFFVYWFLNLSGEANLSGLFSKKGIGFIFPLLSIVFLLMAYRAIKRDDKLVKSVDRLR